MPLNYRILGCLWFLLLCALALQVFSHLGSPLTPYTPYYDIAADMLLQNLIRDEGLLLTGHYSRWNFNHPGPFWFYYNHFMEWVLKPFDLTRFQIWLWGSVLLNSILITYTLAALVFLLRPSRPILFFVACALLIIAFIGEELTGIWMPERMISPFAAFLVTTALLSKGHIRILPIVTLLVCILVHGYVTMPLITFPFLIWSCVMGWRSINGLKGLITYSNQLIFSLLIIIFFVAPIIADAIINEPSNIDKILSANAIFKYYPLPNAKDILQFVHELLIVDRHWQWTGIAIILLLSWRNIVKSWQQPHSRLLLLIFTTAFLYVLGYYSQTPAPLHTFIALFLLSVPPLLVCLSLVQISPKSWLIWIVLFLILTPRFFLLTNDKHVDIKSAANNLSATQKDYPIRIDYDNHYLWPYVAGILLELDRRGIAACTTWQHMSFVYTANKICPANTLPSILLTYGGNCTNDCIFVSEEFDLKKFQLPELIPSSIILHNSSTVFFNHWNDPETDKRWSEGLESDIIFLIGNGSFSGRIELILSTLGKQLVIIEINGYQVLHEELDIYNADVVVNFEPEILNKNDFNLLKFRTPNAQKPKNSTDRRTLAVALHRLNIE